MLLHDVPFKAADWGFRHPEVAGDPFGPRFWLSLEVTAIDVWDVILVYGIYAAAPVFILAALACAWRAKRIVAMPRRTGAFYCRRCNYEVQTTDPLCTECGRSFSRARRRVAGRTWIRRSMAPLALFLMTGAGAFFFLQSHRSNDFAREWAHWPSERVGRLMDIKYPHRLYRQQIAVTRIRLYELEYGELKWKTVVAMGGATGAPLHFDRSGRRLFIPRIHSIEERAPKDGKRLWRWAPRGSLRCYGVIGEAELDQGHYLYTAWGAKDAEELEVYAHDIGSMKSEHLCSLKVALLPRDNLRIHSRVQAISVSGHDDEFTTFYLGPKGLRASRFMPYMSVVRFQIARGASEILEERRTELRVGSGSLVLPHRDSVIINHWQNPEEITELSIEDGSHRSIRTNDWFFEAWHTQIRNPPLPWRDNEVLVYKGGGWFDFAVINVDTGEIVRSYTGDPGIPLIWGSALFDSGNSMAAIGRTTAHARAERDRMGGVHPYFQLRVVIKLDGSSPFGMPQVKSLQSGAQEP